MRETVDVCKRQSDTAQAAYFAHDVQDAIALEELELDVLRSNCTVDKDLPEFIERHGIRNL